MTTAHELLGVPRNASEEEIKRAYRELAQVAHPDKGGDAETFDVVRKAYKEALRLSKLPLKGCEKCEFTGEVVVSRHEYGENKRPCECRTKAK